MSVFNSVSNALVVLIVILMIGGAVFGLAVAGTDLVNPRTSQAEANRIDIETEHQQSIYQQDERRATAETDAYIENAKIETDAISARRASELAYQNQINTIFENFYAGLAVTGQNLLAGLGAAVCLCIVILAIGYAVRVAKPVNITVQSQTHMSKSQAYTPTQDDIRHRDYYRRAKTAEAAYNEQKWNEIRASARKVNHRKEQIILAKRQKPVTWQDLLSSGND